MKKISLLLFGLLALVIFGGITYYRQIFVVPHATGEVLEFSVQEGESLYTITSRLEEEGKITQGLLLRKYMAFKKLDKAIHAGNYRVTAPLTIANIADAFSVPSYDEHTLTFLPGWDNRDVAEYIASQGVASEKDVFAIIGKPNTQRTSFYNTNAEITKNIPRGLSLEGYMAPETFRFFVDDTVEEIIQKLIDHRQKQITKELVDEIEKQGKTVHDILTMASIIEREVRSDKERAMVSDIFWKRMEAGWGLQADSTVHYITGEKGDVFTSKADREIDSPWNTYKYKGLPPGPISMPSMSSILAAIYPEKNDYWFFLTTFEGEVKYAKTLEEHNANVQKYLR